MDQKFVLVIIATILAPALARNLLSPQTVDLVETKSVDEKPWFCHDLDCPDFKVVSKTDDYETRTYPEAVWASTIVPGYLYSTAVATGFYRLFNYISGANAMQLKIAMTAPVRVKVVPGAGPFCESNFTVSFFVPFAYQASPPKPTDDTVFLETAPEQTVYVNSYGGFVLDDHSLAKRVAGLTAKLNEAGLPFVGDFFYTAGYDSPFHLTNRTNEIWVRQSGSSQKPSAALQ